MTAVLSVTSGLDPHSIRKHNLGLVGYVVLGLAKGGFLWSAAWTCSVSLFAIGGFL